MKKLVTSLLLAGLSLSPLSAQVFDVSSSSGWVGFMNVFDTDMNYVFGSGWGTADLRASFTGETVSLAPNTNTYINSLGGNDGDRAFWTNSTNGGATAGLDGNKIMEANFFREDISLVGTTVSFSGTVSSFDLDERYSLIAFVKALDASAGFTTAAIDSAVIDSTGSFSLSLSIDNNPALIPQLGFTMLGLNASPGTDWGSAEIGSLSASFVVPEPSTVALVSGLMILGFVVYRRRRNA